MNRLVLPENALNGGFPEPPVGAPVRIVSAHHDACGASTRVRLPGALPTQAVHRFHCAGCSAAFEAEWVEEIELTTAPVAEAPIEPAPVAAAPPAPEPAPVEPPREASLRSSGELTSVYGGKSTLDRESASPPTPRAPAEPEPEPVPLEVSLMGLIKRTGAAPAAPPTARPAVERGPVAPKPEPVVFVEPEPEPEPEPVVVEPEPVAPAPEPVVFAEPDPVVAQPEPVVPEPEPVVFSQPEPVAPEPEPVAIPESELVVVGPEQDAIEALTVEVPAAKPKSKLITALTAKRSLGKPKVSKPKTAEAEPEGSKSKLVTALTAKRSLGKPKTAEPKPAEAKPKGEKSKLVTALTAKRSLGTPKASLKRPSLKLPSLNPESRSWKLLSIPIAAVLVIIGLFLLNGGSEEPTIPVAPPAAKANNAAGAAGAAGGKEQDSNGGDVPKPSKDTQFVSESLYSLAMPAGWQRIDPPAGATFAAVAPDGAADATLWIKEDPKLDYPTFISQSLTQLETLAGNAEIVERIQGPSAESTIVRLAADAPPGLPSYEVTLRAAGPYRYYLATSVQPDASAEVADGADLVAGSLTPELEG